MPDLAELSDVIRAEIGMGQIDVAHENGVISVRRATDEVVVTGASEILGNSSQGRTILRSLRRGRSMVIVVGDVSKEDRRVLVDRGIFDIHPESPDSFRLNLSIRNALDVQNLRRRISRGSEQNKRNRYELIELIETARLMSSERAIDALLDTILEKCRFITNADAGTIYLIEGLGPLETRKLRFKLTQNDSIHSDWKEFTLPISKESMAGAAVLNRKVINIPDVRHLPSDSKFHHNMSFDERTGYSTRSILVAPMISQSDEVIGVLQLINKKRSANALLFVESDYDDQVIAFDSRSIEIVRSLAAHAAVSLENALLYDNISQILEGFVKASVHAIEQRDPPTSGHSERVAALTCELASYVESSWEGSYGDVTFTEQEMLELRYAALLHDFGKIGVREAVLSKQKKLPEGVLEVIRQRFNTARVSYRLSECREGSEEEAQISEKLQKLDEYWELIVKSNRPRVLDDGKVEKLEELGQANFVDSDGNTRPLVTETEMNYLMIRRGSLSDEELSEIRSHARKSFQFLERIPWGDAFPDLPLIASSHHERLDGTGYPEGLEGRNLPLKARIMAVADVFDALTAADRPYKKAVPLDRALNILRLEVKDRHLDPELVDLFIEKQVYTCVLNSEPD